MSASQPSPVPSEGKELPLRTKEPKVVVIREEFIALTGDPLIAAVLNQLVYWSQRVTNCDLFLKEENASPPQCRSFLQHGWFYKTSSELLEETMLCVTPVTLRRYLNFLEERGWIETRTHPQNKWDRTTQYRVNLRKLSQDLQKKGYALPGYLKFEVLADAHIEEQTIKKPKFSREREKDLSNGKKQSFEHLENDHSKAKKLTSRMENNLTSNTEITVTEYNVGDKELDFAIVKMTGRYPKERRVTNTECKEIVYIQTGQGKVEINGKEYKLNAGDLVLIEAGEKFRWEGNMTLFISCHPAFTIEQHQEVD